MKNTPYTCSQINHNFPFSSKIQKTMIKLSSVWKEKLALVSFNPDFIKCRDKDGSK